jgi:hypothetical protein
MRAAWPWLALLLLGLAPWLLLAGLGGYWLWQNGQILHWLWLAAAASGAVWLAGQWLKKRQTPAFAKLPAFEPDRLWSPTAEAAWAKVEALANALDPAKYPLDEPGKLFTLAHRILAEVARQFHPKAERAELDAPLPSILLIVERVSRDMRELLTGQVPASHLITVADGLALWRWKERLEQLGSLAGVGRMAVNPMGGVLHELRMAFFGRVTRYPLTELERWLLHTLARKIGYYAILLYSGQLRPDGEEQASLASERDLETAARQAERPAEPLRILIAGQTNAGKSSLVNALFGELRAPADALPLTYAPTPYRLERDGEFLGLVLDSPGYGDLASWAEDARAELHGIDLVILVCSATQAGRAADVRFLETLRRRYAATPDRLAPPLVVALTHIDQLRPTREWNPPYNLAEPQGAKESQIRLCMEAVAETLAVPPEQVQAVCLKPGETWNSEAVWATLASQLPEARRARYLRCLKDAQAREKWELMLRQLVSAGRLLSRGIGKILPGA